MASRIYRKNKKIKRTNTKANFNKDRLKLYRKTTEEVNRVNKRLEKLSKSGYSGTWSSKKLLNRIGSKKSGLVQYTRRGKQITGLKISPSATNTQLIAIQKASRQFLDSKTSTISGIKNVKKEVIDSLKKSLGDFDKPLTDKDAEFLYEMLEVQEMQDVAEKFGASRMWAITQDAIEEGDTKEDFFKRFEREISTLNDEDMKKNAERIYEYILNR